MGKMKQLIEDEVEELAMRMFSLQYAFLSEREQQAVWDEATKLAQAKLESWADAVYEQEKDRRLGL